ncbi:hypothetical protein NDI76_15900 [Halogeometricum sp. S1BR25-6]|uniref:Hpr(Ser) kinase/phosphatase n=1 Tax=Halogeometricum salsisoli TaxID=2950536 RepID=A0ABU2GIJ6_9EURY|nr:hypothetical protein [Halogeometricum sp. S1BR25-6]MDS0300231.1 hypothetical protein [Halogeometricum sp. S1BR25-6]
MYSYAAYDLVIRSEFELPELPATADSEKPDVEIKRGDVESVPESLDEFGEHRIVATADVCRLTYENIGSFRIENGQEIVCDLESDAVPEQDFFRGLLENEMLGLILHQRRHLVLHASAVAVNGKAVIFLGPRGAGKSTTAAAFEVAGHSLLEDDVVGIRLEDETPMVVPGVPQLRLKPDAAIALGLTAETVESWYEKRYYPTDVTPDPIPLAGCYILQSGDEISLEELSGTERLLELIPHTYLRGLLVDTEQSSTHLEQCSQIAEQVPFRVLKRPQNHELLPSLVEQVVDDVESNNRLEGDTG